MSDAIVIIPTYNEKENIKSIIEAVFLLPNDFHVLVVDDNSPDGTASIVEELKTIHKDNLHLLSREGKNGLGTAYIDGFKWCLKKDYQFIFEMDADFSHNPKDLVRLYDAANNMGSDVIVGSRYIKGVNVVNWPLTRILLSYGASLYVKLITGMRIQDPTAGFICYKREVLEVINLDEIKFIGYAFQIEMKFKAYKKGFKILEIPIIFTDRIRGKSKMSSGIISEAIFGVISLKWNSLFNKEK
ncbi:dolichyl-phosphate beta-D-mannosyltransferase [Winogradskyella sp. PC-19]|jgi:dolichol-phosphate mannosyltransferase|uniref:polyprenol monophosphomannose synthase n=1 Tax=unclassified Winogradskyella TaxID=2615021 RepID=UPI000B3D43BA|nr:MULTISPECIES: polyprenol monophosphomannose synthase [unclassified Winogradskyella]ARV10021.1 dolichyl-phosphate beta-D-mannosyltransferase [Winogradskyella sp. PC-19]RZN80329.1 MAG: polyprenol monophosphomannose synthase [Winogradskyella sp.]